MGSATPREAVEAFAAAIEALDQPAAKALATAAGWASRGNSAYRLWRQGTKGGLEVHAHRQPWRNGDRAAQRITLYSRRLERNAGALWALLLREPDGWLLEGVVEHPAVAGLFLAGRVPAIVSHNSLPESPDGEAWGRSTLERLAADVLRTAEDADAVWPLPRLGAVPRFDPSPGRPAVAGLGKEHPVYRATIGVADNLVAGEPFVMITSSVSAEGKTTTAGNLACVLARSGRRVALVDVDLRMPRLWRRWDAVEAGPGLVEVMDGSVPLAKALQPSGLEGVDILASGRVPADPSPLYVDPRFAEVLEALCDDYDVVVLDPPTAIEFDDPFDILEVLTRPCAVGVLSELGKTTAQTLAMTRDRFEAFGVSPKGIVLNRASAVYEDLVDLVEDRLVDMQVTRTRALEAVGRIGVELELKRPGDEFGRKVWNILQRDADGELAWVARRATCTLQDLLIDLDVPWDNAWAPRPDDARQVFERVVAAAMQALGDGTITQDQVRSVVAAQLADVPPHADADVVDLWETRRRRAGLPPTPVDADGTANEVQQVVERYIVEHVEAGGQVDDAFMQARGGEIMGQVLGVLLMKALPESLSLEVPVSGHELGERTRGKVNEPHDVTVRLDLPGLLSSLLSPDDP